MAEATASEAAVARRVGSLDGRIAGTALVSILPAPACHRVNLRAGEDALGALEAALGIALPRVPMGSVTESGRSALWLGPDEWLLLDGERDPAADLAGGEAVFSAVDISHRNTAMLVTGPRAADTLEHGCPRDLSVGEFPVGACARTVMGKAEVIVWRGKTDAFRVECWRSFSTYVFDFLSEASRDASLV